jgi:hypothetical protein
MNSCLNFLFCFKSNKENKYETLQNYDSDEEGQELLVIDERKAKKLKKNTNFINEEVKNLNVDEVNTVDKAKSNLYKENFVKEEHNNVDKKNNVNDIEMKDINNDDDEVSSTSSSILSDNEENEINKNNFHSIIDN